MARADLLVRLVRYASRGKSAEFRKTVETLIAEERDKQHHILAERLEETLRANGDQPKGPSALSPVASEPVFELSPERTLDDLILPGHVRLAIDELVEEQHRGDLLRSYNLEPRHRVLLVGPPGNGKTSLAEAMSTALLVPLLSVRYEAVVASYLGETSSRLQRLFDYARTRHCVLFFDEFDTLGKERGDEHETGEIKRVVSNLLLQIDRLPSYVVVVTATNHPELLDRAVWRRFQLRLELPAPEMGEISELLQRVLAGASVSVHSDLLQNAAEALAGASFGEVEDFATDLLRRQVLAGHGSSIDSITHDRINQIRSRYVPPSPHTTES